MTESPYAERRARSPSAQTELTATTLRAWPLPLDPDADKTERGTVLVIGGSTRTAGAVLLSGLAVLRIGAGRLQIATVEPPALSLAAAVPEALVEGIPPTAEGGPDPEAAVDRLADLVAAADAVLIGPGLDDLQATRALLAGLFSHIGAEAVVVLDALALPAFAAIDASVTGALTGRLVLTPNRDEAASLAEAERIDDDRQLVSLVSRRHEALVTMHGLVAAPDGRRWSAEDSVPGLGMSGSGDVLAGLVAGAAARCGDPAQAACWGTFLHVAAGAHLSEEVGPVGFLARELLEPIPRILADAMRSGAAGDAVVFG